MLWNFSNETQNIAHEEYWFIKSFGETRDFDGHMVFEFFFWTILCSFAFHLVENIFLNSEVVSEILNFWNVFLCLQRFFCLGTTYEITKTCYWFGNLITWITKSHFSILVYTNIIILKIIYGFVYLFQLNPNSMSTINKICI